MAESDILRRYLEAGMAFTQLSRERAEAIVRELAKQGEAKLKDNEGLIDEIVEKSRENTDALVGLVRREIAEQLRHLGLEDLARRAQPEEEATANASTAADPFTAAPSAAPDVEPEPLVPDPSAPSAGAAKKPAAAKKSAAVKKAQPAATVKKPAAAKKPAATVKKPAAAKKTAAAKKSGPARG